MTQPTDPFTTWSLKATQAEIWSAFLSDDGETVLQASTEEWIDIVNAEQEDDPDYEINHFDYINQQIEAIKEDGIHDSDTAMALAFYFLAKEALIRAHEGSE